MPINLLVAFVTLIAAVLFLTLRLRIARNVVLLFVSLALTMASTPVMVFVGGIVSVQLVENTALATLPITLMIVGVSAVTIPAALCAKRFGRKISAYIGFSFTFLGALLATLALMKASFVMFCTASLALGASNAFLQQLRFAAIESTADKSQIPTTLSVLMISGLFAAFIGPELTVLTQELIAGPLPFAGSFASLALLSLLAMLVLTGFKNPHIVEEGVQQSNRSVFTIAKQPIFLIALASAAIGYGLMSYLMTATPLSMHQLHGHDLNATKWVIQSHIAAMFLPSLITPWLVKRFGLFSLLVIGTLIYGSVCLVALMGHHVMHYWWALVLLGVGWNFLFLVGTSLLPQTYTEAEKHKSQGLNDFILFSFQALASLLAGWVLFAGGWNTVVYSALPFVVVMIVVCWFYKRVISDK